MSYLRLGSILYNVKHVQHEIRDVIAYPLKLLFERSLEIGQLPADWKYSTITAIYKKGPKTQTWAITDQ